MISEIPSVISESSHEPIYWNEDNIYYDENDTNIALCDAAIATKAKDELDNIVAQLIETEREYIQSLETILNSIPPVPPGLKVQKDILCGTIEKIYHFHKTTFSVELESFTCRPLQIGRCFLKWKQEFNLYTLHNKNKTRRRIASRHLWDNYANIFIRPKTSEPADRLDLSSYVFNPVQRLNDYAKHLNDVIAYCDLKDPRKREIFDACVLIQFHSRHGSDLVAMDAITNADVDLGELGSLLRQDDFSLPSSHYGIMDSLKDAITGICTRRIFLFEKAIVFTKKTQKQETLGESFVYQYSITTVDVSGLTESIGESELKFEISYRKSKKRRFNEALVLESSSTNVKKAWIYDIARIVSKNANGRNDNSLDQGVSGQCNTDETDENLNGSQPGYSNSNFIRKINFRKSVSDYECLELPSSINERSMSVVSATFPVRRKTKPTPPTLEVGISNIAFAEDTPV